MLLKVDNLLEVHLRVVGFFCVVAKRFFVIAYALLGLFAVVLVAEGKDGMRSGSSLLFAWVGVIGGQPPGQVLLLLRLGGSLRPSVPHLLLTIVVEGL